MCAPGAGQPRFQGAAPTMPARNTANRKRLMVRVNTASDGSLLMAILCLSRISKRLVADSRIFVVAVNDGIAKTGDLSLAHNGYEKSRCSAPPGTEHLTLLAELFCAIGAFVLWWTVEGAYL